VWHVDVHLQREARRERGAAGDMMDDAAGPTALVELRPRLTPNPRLSYRTSTFYAGTHPPLAAAMVRMAGVQPDELVWDPFCGTAIELIEASLANPHVQQLVGTDIDGAALAAARAHLEHARALCGVSAPAALHELDFRAAPSSVPELRRGAVSLIVTNPPLGRRVKVHNLRAPHRAAPSHALRVGPSRTRTAPPAPHTLCPDARVRRALPVRLCRRALVSLFARGADALFADLFRVASEVLRPHGRLVLINPLRAVPARNASLQLEARHTVDLGLRHRTGVEVWRKL
jgi:tRNA G10  N-methylase Trm11